MLKKILILLTLFVTINIFSQELNYNVDKPSKLYVGTPFRILVDIKSSINDTIYVPEIDSSDVFIILNNTLTEEVIENEKNTKIEIELAGFDTGQYEVPEFPFLVKTDNEAIDLKTNSFSVFIHPTIADTVQTMHDIAGLKFAQLSIWEILIPILALILLVIGIVYLVKYISKTPEERKVEKVIVDTRPSYIKALELLEGLKQKGYQNSGNILELYFELSYILRFFLEDYFKFNAVEMTTSEIKRNLVIDDHNEKSFLINYMRDCDKVKYAKGLPQISKAESDISELEKYLKSYESKEFKNSENEMEVK